jgi:hypothetical protein
MGAFRAEGARRCLRALHTAGTEPTANIIDEDGGAATCLSVPVHLGPWKGYRRSGTCLHRVHCQARRILASVWEAAGSNLGQHLDFLTDEEWRLLGCYAV